MYVRFGLMVVGGVLVACGGKAKPAEEFSTSTTLDYAEDTLGPPAPGAPTSSKKTVIRAAIRAGAAKLVACAAQEPAAITLTLTFSITASGTVASATAAGGTDATNACAAEVVKSLAFGAQDNLTNVIYPIKIAK